MAWSAKRPTSRRPAAATTTSSSGRGRVEAGEARDVGGEGGERRARAPPRARAAGAARPWRGTPSRHSSRRAVVVWKARRGPGAWCHERRRQRGARGPRPRTRSDGPVASGGGGEAGPRRRRRGRAAAPSPAAAATSCFGSSRSEGEQERGEQERRPDDAAAPGPRAAATRRRAPRTRARAPAPPSRARARRGARGGARARRGPGARRRAEAPRAHSMPGRAGFRLPCAPRCRAPTASAPCSSTGTAPSWTPRRRPIACYVRVFSAYGIGYDRAAFERTYSPDWYRTYEEIGLPREHWPEADARWISLLRDRAEPAPPRRARGARAAGRAGPRPGPRLERRRRAGAARDRGPSALERLLRRRRVRRRDRAPQARPRAPAPRPGAARRRRRPATAYVGDSPEDVAMAKVGRRLRGGHPGRLPEPRGPRRRRGPTCSPRASRRP